MRWVFRSAGGTPLDPNRGKVKSGLKGPGGTVIGGLADRWWKFPAYKSPRFWDFDQVVTTRDGKKVQLVGQVRLRVVSEKDPKMMLDFVEDIAACKYDGKRPGESEEGWENMLVRQFDPLVRAVLRECFGTYHCADFEPACRAIDPRTDVPDPHPEEVYAEVAKVLQERIVQRWGKPYFQDIQVQMREINLPKEVQTNIDRVTAEQARTKSAEQAARTARAEARAIRIKSRALRANPALVQLEIAKACEGGDRCTIVVDGSGRVGAAVPVR